MFIVDQIKATDIKRNDLIKCRNIDAKTDEYREVLATMIPFVDDQLELKCDEEFSICTSSTHPMAVYRNGIEQYIETKDVIVGDLVITSNGYKEVSQIAKGDYQKDFVDFTIDEYNNYYAGNKAHNLILAHNSATIYYPIWHYEVEDLLVLKNNKGTEETRIRHMDYGVQFNKLMYERLLTGKDITLFSPNDVPGLYEAFFNDQELFRELYETAERNTRIRKKKVKAIDLFSNFMQERKDTGRIYLQNVDHANTHSPFDESKWPIKQSNLCVAGDTRVYILINDNEEYVIDIADLPALMVKYEDLKVLSFNEQTNQKEYKKILAAAKTHPDAKILEIEDVETGIKIQCTPEHKIYTKNRGYVEAKDLKEDDQLLLK